MLPVPGNVTQTTTHGADYTARVATPGLRSAMDERRSAAAGQGSASAQRIYQAEMAGDAIKAEQEAKNLTMEKNRLLQQEEIRMAQADEREANRRQLAAEQALKKKEEGLRAMDNQTFWGDQKTWQKVLYGISLALGGYGAAFSKGQNGAAMVLGNALTQWGDRHDKRLKMLYDDVVSGRAKVGTVGQDYLAEQMKLKPLRMAAAAGRIGDIAEREAQALQAAGNKDAAARAFKLVSDMRAEEAKNRMEAARLEEQSQQFLAPNVAKQGDVTIKQNTGSGMAEGTVLDRQGKPVGVAPAKAEGPKSREAQAQLKPIEKGLDAIDALVKDSTIWDRVAGGFTDRNKKIEGLLAPLIPMISQLTGSGTPQEGEAKRMLNTIRTSITQGKEVTRENIANLKSTLQSAYDAKVQSLVPGYKPPTQTNLSPKDQEAVDWARANPNDPRSAAILKANGF